MYNYHSPRNRIQLIGRIATDPTKYETPKGLVIRIVIEVSERDDNYELFYSHHVAIVPADRLVPHIELDLKKNAQILIQGRLNNRRDKKTGKPICNVQATELMVLEHPPAPEKTPEEKAREQATLKRAGELLKDSEFVQNLISGKIVPLASRRRAEEEEIDEGDEYGEVDEDGRIDDPYKTWRKWKRDGDDWLPF